jgi:hypothetical protein
MTAHEKENKFGAPNRKSATTCLSLQGCARKAEMEL